MALSMSTIAGQQLNTNPTQSPKRKRQTSLSASDSLFAPDLARASRSPSRISSSPTPPPSPSLKPSHQTHISSNSSPTSTPRLQIPLLENEVQEPYAGADSPRSAVARKLEGLDLALRGGRAPILHFGDAVTTDRASDAKKVKLDPSGPSTPALSLDPSSLRASSPTKLSRSKSPTALAASSINWWSDAEITGHLGDDPEDDGYGINGIGFKPTPAMAAARSVKRRRQIEEWRTREMREERRRRAEGRRGRVGSADPGGGGGGGANTGAGVGKRSVRFASS